MRDRRLAQRSKLVGVKFCPTHARTYRKLNTELVKLMSQLIHKDIGSF